MPSNPPSKPRHPHIHPPPHRTPNIPKPPTIDILPGGPNTTHIPRPLSSAQLPAKYKSAERKVRLIIIALPIAIVTSWVLYKRLVEGEERKRFIPKTAIEIAPPPPPGPSQTSLHSPHERSSTTTTPVREQ
ncbi:hypothetical protein DFH27DRAFT_539494 [Peziza echinospora]|nr:hypothetical protein DFH27DRAFT_539494 [Peziza echinospora]